MTCSIFRIEGPMQAGKTTMAIGALKELSNSGIDVLYLTTNRDTAEMFERTHSIPCKGLGAKFSTEDIPDSAKAVVIDNLCYFNYEPEDIYKIRDALNFQHSGVTQLILVYETS